MGSGVILSIKTTLLSMNKKNGRKSTVTIVKQLNNVKNKPKVD